MNNTPHPPHFGPALASLFAALGWLLLGLGILALGALGIRSFASKAARAFTRAQSAFRGETHNPDINT